MLSNKILPKFLKDVLQHIPTLALKSMDWKAVLKEMGPLLIRFGAKDLTESKRQSIQTLNIEGLELSHHKAFKKELTSEEKTAQGQTILRLYFSQLKNSDGLNLDLRTQHFALNNNLLTWKPNNSWYQLEDSFRNALIDLYTGFYHNNEKRFDKALLTIGLSTNLNEQKKQELKGLFYAHFGPGDQDIVKFKISNFSESFYELFHFFIKNEVKLEKDFIFIGIYLVTLYIHLEELDQQFDVKKAFLEVFPID